MDGPEGYASLEKLSVVPLGPRSKTPRGGLHILYRGGTLTTTARRLPGLDMRGAGGYVVVPPSHGYEWLVAPDGTPLPEPPEALRELVTTRAPLQAVVGAPVDVTDPTLKALLMMAQIPLRTVAKGERELVLFKLGCSLRARGSDAQGIRYLLGVANALLCVPPTTEAEVSHAAATSARYAMSPEYQRHAETIRQAEERQALAEARVAEVKSKAEAKAETQKERAKERAAKAQDALDDLVDGAALDAAGDAATGSAEALRDLIAHATGVRVLGVVQSGRDNPAYAFDLGDGDPVHVGASLQMQAPVAEAMLRQRQSTGFADLTPKQWRAIRRALMALVVVRNDVELERTGQTLSLLRDWVQQERANHRLVKDQPTLRKRAPFEEDGLLWFSATGFQRWLATGGTPITYHEAAHRLQEAGCERHGSGVVTLLTEGGEKIQARYWYISAETVLSN